MTNGQLTRKLFTAVLLLNLLGGISLPALAETHYDRIYDAHLQRYVYVPARTPSQKFKTGLNRAIASPVIKQAAIGAAAGAATGLFTDHSSVLKGAGIGALVGGGTGWLDKSGVLDDHPAIKTASKGAAIGTGLGIITGKGGVKGAVIGAAAGTGVHFLKEYLDNRPQNYYGN